MNHFADNQYVALSRKKRKSDNDQPIDLPPHGSSSPALVSL
jgi:hypothetical protein